MKLEVVDKELCINGRSIRFDQRIAKWVEVDGKAVLLLNSDDFEKGDELVGRNIVAYDEQGEFVWRIEYHGYKVTNRDGVDVPQAFFGLWIDKESGILKAGIPVAVFDVDPETGMFLKVELDRW